MKKMDRAVLASAIGKSGFFKGLSPVACKDLAGLRG